MIREYVEAALRHAECEYLENDKLYYCEIPGLQGVWSAAETEQKSRQELAEVVEGWVELGLRHGHRIPVVDGIDLNVARAG